MHSESPDDLLFEEAYDELRRLAGGALGMLPPGATLQPTALVHEVWLRFGKRAEGMVRDRDHFMVLASLAMRQILVDAARRRRAAKRGGDAKRLTLMEEIVPGRPEELDVLDMHEALEHLALVAPRPARLVEMRFFGGLDVMEAARALGIGKTTALLDWRFARAWLAERLATGTGP